jgi:hypothetical protein
MSTPNPLVYGGVITGTLTGATAVVIVNNLKPISTIVFNSTTSPTIQLSLDGTTFYPAVTPTGTKSGQIYYVLNFPVAAIQFTGATNDTYSIL